MSNECKTCNGTGIEYDGAGHICTACNGVKADPLPPANDVEVLAWALNDGNEHPIDITLQWGVAKHWPEYVTPLVDRAHVTRLQIIVDASEHVEQHLQKQIDIERIGRESAEQNVTRLQAEVERLNKDNEAFAVECVDRGNANATLQSELAKARELIRDAVDNGEIGRDDVYESLHEYLAHQSEPAAKGEGDE